MSANAAADPQLKRAVLQARALELARPPGFSAAPAPALQLLEFHLAHERYAVETLFVREVTPLKEITPLPCTPPFVRGITNVRGQILAVIDIKKFFDLPDGGITDLNKIIVLKGGDMEIALLADSVEGGCEIALDVLQPSLPTLTGIREEYLRGITPDRLVVLDVSRILSSRRILVQESVDTQA